MKPHLVVFWCRSDFRLGDNPALHQSTQFAQQHKYQFLPLSFLDDDLLNSDWMNIGTARRLQLSKVLARFILQFSRYHLVIGSIYDFFELLSTHYTLSLFVNSQGEPFSIRRFEKVNTIITDNGGAFTICDDYLSVPKNTISGSGNLYSVFTPFKNTVLPGFLEMPLTPTVDPNTVQPLETSQYTHIKSLQKHLSEPTETNIYQLIQRPNILHFGVHHSLNLENYFPNPVVDMSTSESDARDWFRVFLSKNILNYQIGRDSLEMDTIEKGATSKMSTALAFGLLSSRQLKHWICVNYSDILSTNENLTHYITELIWREFYRYILIHHPTVLDTEFQVKFRKTITWQPENIAIARFTKWINAETGYPLVDACMKQISTTGWMHNRGRMLVASILTKNLGVDWRWGQDYFRRVLVDFDEASNNGGWQWAASVGSDPKPIRIFNPYLQAEKYDPRRLFQLHWLTPGYDADTHPIIDHKDARTEALLRYSLIKTNSESTPIRDF
jgi:deoxyribodipyrimidine photo-lyase